MEAVYLAATLCSQQRTTPVTSAPQPANHRTSPPAAQPQPTTSGVCHLPRYYTPPPLRIPQSLPPPCHPASQPLQTPYTHREPPPSASLPP
nr:hypothetical protein Iba_scaffold446CG0620 [Ipomoea batatas]